MFDYDNVTLTLAADQAPPEGEAVGVRDTNTKIEQPDNKEENTNTGGGSFGGQLIFMLLGLMVLMFIMTSFSQKKEKRRRAEMLESLKKNDKVVTIGGVIGTVVEVKATEITLKVDESSNTRMRFSRSSIQGVITDDGDTTE